MPKQRGKSEQELKRKKRFRRPSKLILIVVEGQETEYNYFSELKQDLKLPTTTIKVVSGSGGSCIDIVKNAIKLCEANQKDNQKKGKPKYDEVFCLFDGDRPEYQEAINNAHGYSRYTIKPILPVPCFEFWFLLHYRYTSSPFENCKQLIEQLNRELKQVGLEDYDKSNSGYYNLLKLKLDQAIANAQKLEKQLSESNNPSTTIHHLVTHLQAQKKV
ncbi:MAG: RloB family protein [Coleofasciculus sp. B1-GNL1-01]|uniref:RloB family protein n=1 Tax=Coleofasciculus sp. B1-GNL1-01 TaxID=3068484 RepID=UPI0032F6787B